MLGSEALDLLWRILLCLALIFLPAFASCALAISKGLRSSLWLGLLALAQIGTVGYLSFWLWFTSRPLGGIFSLCLPPISLAYLVFFLSRSNSSDRAALKSLLLPTALTGIATLVVLSAGFLYGGIDAPLKTAAVRFSHTLPADNELPYLLAKAMSQGPPPIPLFGDWLSSDRPPLQTGIVLSGFAYAWGELMYQVVSTALQSLWIFALYLFLHALRIDSRAIRLILITCLFSGFTFLNSFFVWPKLLAASYVLAFSTLLLPPGLLRELKASYRKCVLAGVLLALAMLSHGGAIFSIIALVLLALFRHARALMDRRIIVVLLTCFCFYLPWILYQKLYDPPGDRLLKWHLAGVMPWTPTPFGEAFVKAYTELPLDKILDYKRSNFETVLGNGATYWGDLASLILHVGKSDPKDRYLVQQDALHLRIISFFQTVPCLGFLMLGPFALLAGLRRRFRSTEWNAASVLFAYSVLTITVWCLILFGPATTVIHQGSYALILLAFTTSLLAFWAISPLLARTISTLQIAANSLLYGFCLHESASTPNHFAGHLRPLTLLLFCSAVCLLIMLLRKTEEVTKAEQPSHELAVTEA